MRHAPSRSCVVTQQEVSTLDAWASQHRQQHMDQLHRFPIWVEPKVQPPIDCRKANPMATALGATPLGAAYVASCCARPPFPFLHEGAKCALACPPRTLSRIWLLAATCIPPRALQIGTPVRIRGVQVGWVGWG